MKKATNHIYLIILLSVLSSVAPMGVDTYLPSIPDIAKSFDVSIHKIELSLSIFLKIACLDKHFNNTNCP